MSIMENYENTSIEVNAIIMNSCKKIIENVNTISNFVLPPISYTIFGTYILVRQRFKASLSFEIEALQLIYFCQ